MDADRNSCISLHEKFDNFSSSDEVAALARNLLKAELASKFPINVQLPLQYTNYRSNRTSTASVTVGQARHDTGAQEQKTAG